MELPQDGPFDLAITPIAFVPFHFLGHTTEAIEEPLAPKGMAVNNRKESLVDPR